MEVTCVYVCMYVCILIYLFVTLTGTKNEDRTITNTKLR
jgi:hypothetical protein